MEMTVCALLRKDEGGPWSTDRRAEGRQTNFQIRMSTQKALETPNTHTQKIALREFPYMCTDG